MLFFQCYFKRSIGNFSKKNILIKNPLVQSQFIAYQSSYNLPPLTQPLKHLSRVKYPKINKTIYETHVTSLENGLRVASEKHFGDFCTVGVIIDAGPRYEKPYMNGITHFLEKLAFNSTTKFRNRDHIMEKLEKHGAICDCQSGRDSIIYALSCRRSGLPEILDLLAETIYRPTFTESEVF